MHASNVAYLLKIRPCFLMIVVAGREEEFQSFGVTLTGFPLTLWRASDDFLLSTCEPPSPLPYMFPVSVYSTQLFFVPFLALSYCTVSIDNTFPNF